MSRTGDQSLGIPNGAGDMSTALSHAIELENKGVIPYVIDEQGHFRSTRTYPRVCIFTKDAMIPVAGDTLLYVKGETQTPVLKYASKHQNHSIQGTDSITHVFDGGQPITGQSHQPIVENMDACKGVYATFEVYGPKFRKGLIEYRDTTNKENGVKMRIAQQNRVYQTFGCANSGFMNENNTIILS